MGFDPAEVTTGVAEVLAARGLAAPAEPSPDGGVRFRLGDVTIVVGPLPSARAGAALLQPRALLVLEGEGPLADALKDAIRLKFLRVAG
jgi:hypothetical protein